MFVASLIGLAAVIVAAALAVCSGHIPWLARLTGAAPLQPAEPDPARDFAASEAAGYITRPDWDDKEVAS